MSEKEQFCPDDKPCTDCTSRRTFSKRVALFAVGIAGTLGLGGDRRVQSLYQRYISGEKRPATDDEIREFMEDFKQAPNWQADTPQDMLDAVNNGDVEYFRPIMQVPKDEPGKAAAICGYCYCYSLFSASGESWCGSACTGDRCCYCYPRCYQASTCTIYYPPRYMLHCGWC